VLDGAFDIQKLQARLVQEQEYITIINTPERPRKSNRVVQFVNVQTRVPLLPLRVFDGLREYVPPYVVYSLCIRRCCRHQKWRARLMIAARKASEGALPRAIRFQVDAVKESFSVPVFCLLMIYQSILSISCSVLPNISCQ
jgi:hypothetical protein